MSSTNKTTNYQLSQYIGTDKPTYLGDYNTDMGKIDTAIKSASDAASTASSAAGSAQSVASEAKELAESANSDIEGINETLSSHDSRINTAQTAANTAQSTASSANQKATNNANEITGLQTQVGNLNNPMVYGTPTPGPKLSNTYFYVSYNKTTKQLFINGTADISGAGNSYETMFTIPATIMNLLNLTSQRQLHAGYAYYSPGVAPYGGRADWRLSADGTVTAQCNTNVQIVEFNAVLDTSSWT